MRVGTGQLARMRNYFLTFLFGGEGGLYFLRHYGIALLGVAHLIPLLFWHVSTDKGKGRREGGRRRKEGRPRDGANPRHLSAEHCIRFLCHEADVFPNQT